MRNSGLDLLKALCIMLVIYTHSAIAESKEGIIYPLLVDMAVPIFMVVSGYVNGISMKRKTNYYSYEGLKKKMLGILAPFLLCIIIELAYLLGNGISYIDILKRLLFGLWGDGSYYPYVLVQFVLLFPIIYKFSNSIKNVAIIIFVNIVFEYLTTIGIIPSVIHRLCIFRYLGFIVAGILIEKNKHKITKWHIFAAAFVGIIISYINYKIPTHHIFGYWTTTSLPVVIWAVAIVCLFDKISDDCFNNRGLKMLVNMGKRTYYIFMFQMLYYFFIGKTSIIEPHFIISIVLCCVFGSLWYEGENILKAKLKKFQALK